MLLQHAAQTGRRLASRAVCGRSEYLFCASSRRAFQLSAIAQDEPLPTSKQEAQSVRGLIYEQNGDPREVVRGHVWPLNDGRRPDKGEVLLRVGLASINPADINVVQGVYPARPERRSVSGIEEGVFIGGNEGFGVVEAVGDERNEAGLAKGDWVVFGQPQMGTWRSHLTCSTKDVIKIQRRPDSRLTPVMASTLQVNPATAWRMLHDFVELDNANDVVIQNAANSAVGQAVAQLCSRKLHIPTINLVRDRESLDDLRRTFDAYGKDHGTAMAHLFTYESLRDKKSGAKERIKELIGDRRVRLGLNAVCGPDNENMAKLLGPDATLVTYGAMSKQPFSMPAGPLIFHNVVVRGFMMNKWYAEHKGAPRRELMQSLVDAYEDGVLEPPDHTIVELNEDDAVDALTDKAREAIEVSMAGRGNKHFLQFSKP